MAEPGTRRSASSWQNRKSFLFRKRKLIKVGPSIASGPSKYEQRVFPSHCHMRIPCARRTANRFYFVSSFICKTSSIEVIQLSSSVMASKYHHFVTYNSSSSPVSRLGPTFIAAKWVCHCLSWVVFKVVSMKIISVKPVITCKYKHSSFINYCSMGMPRWRRVAWALNFSSSISRNIVFVKVVYSIITVVPSVYVYTFFVNYWNMPVSRRWGLVCVWNNRSVHCVKIKSTKLIRSLHSIISSKYV